MSKSNEIIMLPSEGVPPLDSAINLVLNLLAQEDHSNSNVIDLNPTTKEAGECDEHNKTCRPVST